MAEARNVFGEKLSECCTRPLTGFYRTGSCETGPEDVGVHTVCTRVDAEFLALPVGSGTDRWHSSSVRKAILPRDAYVFIYAGSTLATCHDPICRVSKNASQFRAIISETETETEPSLCVPSTLIWRLCLIISVFGFR